MSASQAIFDVLIAVGIGVALWLFLPRGVVLTRSALQSEQQHPHDQPFVDRWRVQNDSSMPIHIMSATVESVDTYDSKTDRIVAVDVATHGGVTMTFDDPTAETTRNDRLGSSWDGVDIESGDTLTVGLGNMTTLTIRYRRAGWSGVLERRVLRIHGYD